MRIVVGLLLVFCCFTEAFQTVVQYSLDSRACARGVVTSAVGASPETSQLVRNNNNRSICEPSLGITSSFSGAITAEDDDRSVLSSVGPMADLWGSSSSMATTFVEGITLDVWFHVHDLWTNDVHTLVAIGSRQMAAKDANDDISVCGQNHVDLWITVRSSNNNDNHQLVHMYYRTSDTVFEPCQEMSVPIEENKMVHMVVSLTDRAQQIVVNGAVPDGGTKTEPFDPSLSHWNSDYGLYLLSYPYGVDSFSQMGRVTIYQLALYSGSATVRDARALLRQGLPKSPPFALHYSVQINEDAERVPGSHPAEWYRRPSPIEEAQTIELQVGSVDDEVRALQTSAGLDNLSPLDPVYVFIQGLEPLGCLYVDGVSMGCAVGPRLSLAIAVYGRQVAYLPPLNAHSRDNNTFATIFYCVSNLPLQDDQCLSGAVQIVVQPVNDPPVATTPKLTVVPDGLETRETPLIHLTGTDVDDGDTISVVEITEPPKHGYLILVVRSFRADGLVHGTLLSDVDFTVPSSAYDPVHVKYIWDANLPPRVVVVDDSISDSFRFRVAGSDGVWSSEAIAQVAIASALTLIADQTIMLEEDSRTQGNIKWLGIDTSGFRREIGFFVDHVPPADHGVLLDDNGRVVGNGTMLDYREPSPYSAGIHLTFLPSPNYCSDASSMDLRIGFRLIAFSTLINQIESASPMTLQQLEVNCRRDSLTLTGPSVTLFVRALSLRTAASVYATLVQENSNDIEPGLVSIVSDLQITSRDTSSSSLVEATVRSVSGLLAFNPAYWNLTTPLLGRRVLSGDNVTFLAKATDLSHILAGLRYLSFEVGNDAVMIQLQYGNCSDVWPVDQETQAKGTPHCQISRLDVPVSVSADVWTRAGGSQLVVGFPWQVLFCMVCYPAIYYAIARLRDASCRLDEDDETVLEEDLPLWIQHLSDTGDFYYENTESGEVTWLAPIGEAFVPWADEREESKSEERP